MALPPVKKHRLGHLAQVLAVASSVATAQSLPPVRRLDRVQRISTEPLAAVSQVRALPDGRVLVNDNTGRRLVLFDSTLAMLSVIADTTAATANAYGNGLGGLIAYHADSSLFVDPLALSMYVIDGNGKIVRTLAVPQPREANFLIGGPYGTPGLDGQGRLVYKARVGGFLKVTSMPVTGQPARPDIPDSGMVVRFDLLSRKADTVAKFVVPKLVTHRSVDENRWVTSIRIVNPLPWTDDWALLADGSVAIVHGQDYRVDLYDATGKLTSQAKLPFDWQKLSDADKSAIIDSTRAALLAADSVAGLPTHAQRAADSIQTVRRLAVPEQTVAPTTGTSGGRMMNLTSLTQVITLDEMPDYRPPFRPAAARGDADGYLWIRTSNTMNGGTVYDVINPRGMLVERIQVPPGRIIAGFGPGGTVYMGVADGNITRLERARAIITGK